MVGSDTAHFAAKDQIILDGRDNGGHRCFRRWAGVIVDTPDTMSGVTGAAQSLTPERRDGIVRRAGTAVGECAYNVWWQTGTRQGCRPVSFAEFAGLY
jgi:hypothetical protein